MVIATVCVAVDILHAAGAVHQSSLLRRQRLKPSPAWRLELNSRDRRAESTWLLLWYLILFIMLSYSILLNRFND